MAPLETMAVLANIANNTAGPGSIDFSLARNAGNSLLAPKVFHRSQSYEPSVTRSTPPENFSLDVRVKHYVAELTLIDETLAPMQHSMSEPRSGSDRIKRA